MSKEFEEINPNCKLTFFPPITSRENEREREREKWRFLCVYEHEEIKFPPLVATQSLAWTFGIAYLLTTRRIKELQIVQIATECQSLRCTVCTDWQENLSGARTRRLSRYKRKKNPTMSFWLQNSFRQREVTMKHHFLGFVQIVSIWARLFQSFTVRYGFYYMLTEYYLLPKKCVPKRVHR